KIGRTPPRKESEWFSDNKGIKWVSIKDMGNSQMYIYDTTEFLTKEAVDKFNVPLVEENTLILSFKLTVGRIAIASEKICTNEAIAQFKNPIISSLYLYFYFKNFSFETLGNTSSIGNAVNSKIIREIRILIPNNEVLDYFLKAAKPISDYIRVLLSQNKKLTEIRDALLPNLMSGEIDVSNIKIKGEEVKNE
ncbi:MAG: restriction endonuclease subunit S, partial [Peptoniphilus grossensis]